MFKRICQAIQHRLGRPTEAQRLRESIRALFHFERVDVDITYKAVSVLERADLGIGQRPLAGFLTSASHQAAYSSLHQQLYMLPRSATNRAAIVRIRAGAQDKVTAPLPKPWRDALEASGTPVSRWSSALALWRMAFRDWAGGVSHILRLAGPQHDFAAAPSQPYGVLVNASSAELLAPPDRRGKGQVVDYLSWYQGWTERNPAITTFWVQTYTARDYIDPQSRFVRWALPRVTISKRKIMFVAASLLNAATSLLGMLVGRWWMGCLLREVVWHDYASLLPASMLAREYLFEVANSGLHRPLWSYLAEARGARIVLAYYGANVLTFSYGRAPEAVVGNGDCLTTWPEYVVMSEDQAAAIATLRKTPFKYTVCPTVGHNDDGMPIPDLGRKPTVSVFDVVPSRIRRRAMSGIVFHFYSAPVCRRFLEDIEAAAETFGFTVALKSKRDNAKIDDPSYTALKAKLYRQGTTLYIPTTIAPQRLIEATNMTISMPFTSTANIAKGLGKPSIFYDPSGTLAAVCPRLHDVDIISGRDALFAWFAAQANHLKTGAMPDDARPQGAA